MRGGEGGEGGRGGGRGRDRDEVKEEEERKREETSTPKGLMTYAWADGESWGLFLCEMFTYVNAWAIGPLGATAQKARNQIE